jgi:hypothetical protein
MAIIELTSSRNVAYNEGQPTGIREYHCHPYPTEADVVALIGAPNGLPGKMDSWPNAAYPVEGTNLRVFDHAIRRDPNVTQAWLVTVTYRQRSERASVPAALRITPSAPGAVTVRIDQNATFEDTWRQWGSWSEILANSSLLDANQVPRYPPFSAESDIKGKKIDAAGYPVSVLRYKARLIIDVVDYRRTRLNAELVGTRNSKDFAGFLRGMVLYTGANFVELPNGMFNLSYSFEIDALYHLKQIPKRQANGYVVLDLPSNPNDQTATGQAKIVSYVQPHPLVNDHYQINPRFSVL